MSPQSRLYRRVDNFEFWIVWQPDIQCYEVYLDPDGETYLGVCDDTAQVNALIDDHLACWGRTTRR